MILKPTVAVAAIILVALAGGVLRFYSNSRTEDLPYPLADLEKNHLESNENPPAAPLGGAIESQEKALEVKSSSAASRFQTEIPIREQVSPVDEVRGNSDRGALQELEPAEESEVISRPFPLSASMETQCKDLGKEAACQETLELLSKFSREPRDIAWSATVENKLAEHARTRDPNMLSVRNIECRKSICAYEVSSEYGPALIPAYGDPFYNNVWIQTSDHSYETNATGKRVTVTLWMLIRQQRTVPAGG